MRSNDRNNERDNYYRRDNDPQHRFVDGDDDDRGFMDRANDMMERAGDQVRSWFNGDEGPQDAPSDGRGGPNQDNRSRNFGQDGDESGRLRAEHEHHVGYSGQGYRGGMGNYAHGNQGTYQGGAQRDIYRGGQDRNNGPQTNQYGQRSQGGNGSFNPQSGPSNDRSYRDQSDRNNQSYGNRDYDSRPGSFGSQDNYGNQGRFSAQPSQPSQHLHGSYAGQGNFGSQGGGSQYGQNSHGTQYGTHSQYGQYGQGQGNQHGQSSQYGQQRTQGDFGNTRGYGPLQPQQPQQPQRSYGSQGQTNPSDSRGRHFGRGPKGYRRSDERLTEEINERLTHHPDIDASELEVSVKDGAVTLTGTVDDRHTRRMIEDLVEDLAGVSDVHNQIRLHRNQHSSQDLTSSTGSQRGSNAPSQHTSATTERPRNGTGSASATDPGSDHKPSDSKARGASKSAT